MTELLYDHLLANEHAQRMGSFAKRKTNTHHSLCREFLKHFIIQSSQLWGRGVVLASLHARK